MSLSYERMMEAKYQKEKLFIQDRLVDGANVDVIGALARSYGMPLPIMCYQVGANILDPDLDGLRESLLARVPKLTEYQITALQKENDLGEWTKLKARLKRLKLWERVKPYTLQEIK